MDADRFLGRKFDCSRYRYPREMLKMVQLGHKNTITIALNKCDLDITRDFPRVRTVYGKKLSIITTCG